MVDAPNPSATASSPPRAPWQVHRLSVGGCAYHKQDRRSHYEISAATTLTRTDPLTALTVEWGQLSNGPVVDITELSERHPALLLVEIAEEGTLF